jgi:hypothetical protein
MNNVDEDFSSLLIAHSSLFIASGGEGGIRTHVTAFGRQTDFESVPLRPLRYLSLTQLLKKRGHQLTTFVLHDPGNDFDLMIQARILNQCI